MFADRTSPASLGRSFLLEEPHESPESPALHGESFGKAKKVDWIGVDCSGWKSQTSWIVKSNSEKKKKEGTGIAINNLPRHFCYRKEVGDILKTDLGTFTGTGIATKQLPRHFCYRENNFDKVFKIPKYLDTWSIDTWSTDTQGQMFRLPSLGLQSAWATKCANKVCNIRNVLAFI